ncbi:MAG: GNAT family N-acetyltransferase [Chitinophagales bacterium]
MKGLEILHYSSVAEANLAANNLARVVYSETELKFAQNDQIKEQWFYDYILVLKAGKQLAGAAVYLNPKIKYNNNKVLFIGNFESIDNADAVKALISTIESIAKNKGINFIIGPMNGSTWNNYRFSITDRFPPFFSEPYHHFYYNVLFEKAGFVSIADYVSNISQKFNHDSKEVLEATKRFVNAGIKFRNVDMMNFENDIRAIFDLSLDAFKNNFLYSPTSWENFRDKYLRFQNMIKPEHIIIAEDEHVCVGFIFGFEDFYNSVDKVFIIKSMARDKDRKYKGLGTVLGDKIIKMAYESGYSTLIHALIFVDNKSNIISGKYSGKEYVRYKLYGKSLW